jgi:Tol biopolymer transport system component
VSLYVHAKLFRQIWRSELPSSGVGDSSVARPMANHPAPPAGRAATRSNVERERSASLTGRVWRSSSRRAMHEKPRLGITAGAGSKTLPLYTRSMKPIRGGLLSAVGVALLALSPATSWATFPGANGRIAFVGYPRSEQPDINQANIFTVLPSGSGLQQLINDSDGESDPSWSADGERIVYIDSLPEHPGVFTMSADGGNQTRVTDGPHSNPQFSPSGQRIVYANDTADSIFTVRTDGTHKRRIAGNGAERPVYAPTGRRIVFDRFGDSERKNGIWKVSPDGTHQRRLTNPGASYYDKLLDWRPDGGRILFVRCEFVNGYCFHSRFRVVRPDGSHEHRLRTVYAGVYSPSGRRYTAYQYSVDGLHGDGVVCSDIYTILLDDSGRRVVTHNCEDYGRHGGPGAFAYQPNWQPIPQP